MTVSPSRELWWKGVDLRGATNQGPLKSQLSLDCLGKGSTGNKGLQSANVRKNSRDLLVCGGPERCTILPQMTQLLRGQAGPLQSREHPSRVCVSRTVLLPTPLGVEMPDGEEEGQGLQAGLVENELCAVCIQSQKGSHGRRESGGELGGGKWRPGGIQVSDPVTPCPSSHRLCCFSSQVLINASPARLTILPISRDTIKSYC